MWSLRSPWPDPCSWCQDEALTPVSSLRCHRCRLDALGSRRSPDPGRLHVISSSNPIILYEASRASLRSALGYQATGDRRANEAFLILRRLRRSDGMRQAFGKDVMHLFALALTLSLADFAVASAQTATPD